MASRRDQLHSYQFSVQRLVAALVMRDPYAEASPFSRVSGSAFAGIMITLLVISGFGIYGLFRPGGNQGWTHDNTVIVEKESGAVYVYRDHLLHPVVNITSALLIAGGNAAGEIQTVSRGSLAQTPRGNTLGIPNAPASLPPAANVVGAPWTLCSRPGHDSAGHDVTHTVLVVGRNPRGGRGLGEKGLLVTDSSSGTDYLIWHQHRYAIGDSRATLGALLWDQKTPLTVGPAWLTALPAGQTIEPIRLGSRGGASTAVHGARVGELFRVREAGTTHYFVAEPTALAGITQLQAQILLGDPDTQQAYSSGESEYVDLPLSSANAARKDNSLYPDGDTAPPANTPTLVSPRTDAASCAAYRDAKGRPDVVYDASVPAPDNGSSTTGTASGGTALADRVVVPPGHASIVRAVAGPDSAAGGLNLVTDLGYRYPVPSADVLTALGYSGTSVVTLPGSLVARIPAGPALDPDAAKSPVPVGDR